jgi:hypothetical protein
MSREIERLKRRIQELQEEKCQSSSGHDRPDEHHVELPAATTSTTSLPIDLDPLSQHGGNKRYYNWDAVPANKREPKSQMYGPSSSFYFLSQMCRHLGTDLQPRPPMHPHNGRFTWQSSNDQGHGGVLYHGIDLNLSRSQEKSILDRYWQTYHSISPVLDKKEFSAQYESLWEHSNSRREPSALVDHLLALGMQCWSASPIANRNAKDIPTDFDSSDGATQGRSWHRRGQSILVEELEEPTISTFQCHLLSVRWLSNAGFHNMAHSVLATGIRVGIILGLHLEPPTKLLPTQRQSRKQLWWYMYATDMKFAMELGRPLAVHLSNVTCTLPNDQPEATSTVETSPCVAFIPQFVRLILATRAIYVTFYKRCGEVLSRGALESLYQDSAALEECAAYLASTTRYLDAWVHQVPKKTRRVQGGCHEAFSTDAYRLLLPASDDFESARQLVILELLYHHLAVSLYRPFIAFSTSNTFTGLHTRNHALSCANHAITLTMLIHQLLTESNYLDGWVETVQWQWTAAISLVGYTIAHHNEPLALEAHKALETALAVLGVLSRSLSGAVAAESMLRDLMFKANQFISRGDIPKPVVAPTGLHYTYGTSNHDLDATQSRTGESSVTLTGSTYDDAFGAWQDALASAPGCYFTPSSFAGLGSLDTDTAFMFDFLDFEAFDNP